MCFALVIFAVLPMVKPTLETYLSSRDSTAYLLKNYDVQAPIMCSKMFVRGTRYYTGLPVVYADVSGGEFFSPHPIPYLRTDDEVRRFVKTHGTVYGFLRRGPAEHFSRVTPDLQVEELKVFGDQHLVRVTLKSRGKTGKK